MADNTCYSKSNSRCLIIMLIILIIHVLGGIKEIFAANNFAPPPPDNFASRLFWISKTPVPGDNPFDPGRIIGIEGAGAGIINDILYISHGYKGSDGITLFAYDIAKNTWTKKRSASIPRSELIGVVGADGKYYAIGGRPTIREVEIYNPITDSWSFGPPMPTGRGGLGAAVIGNKIYVLGGRNGAVPHSGIPLNVTEVYDVTSKTWSIHKPMPQPMMDIYSTVAYNEKIYVIGGYDGTSVSRKVQIYDPSTDTWSFGAEMPTPRSNLIAGVLGGRIIAIGGFDGSKNLSVVEIYDPIINTWTIGPPKPTPASEMAASGNFTSDAIFAVGSGIFGAAQIVHEALALSVSFLPIANEKSVTTQEDIFTTITLTGIDPDGDVLKSFKLDTPPQNGTLSPFSSVVNNSSTVTYTPNPNFNGSDSFTFTVNNGKLDSAPAKVTINVTPVNDPPIANSKSVTTLTDQVVTITLTGIDPDGDVLKSFKLDTSPQNGTLSPFSSVVNNSSTVTYTPNPNFNGSDSFTFIVNNGKLDSAPAKVTIIVVVENKKPIAHPKSKVTTTEDQPIIITLTGGDPENATLTFIVVQKPQNGGTLSPFSPVDNNSATITFTPKVNHDGTDIFTFKVTDGMLDSDPATIEITMIPVDDPPIANQRIDPPVEVSENVPVEIDLTGSDPENSPLRFIVVSNPVHGFLSDAKSTSTNTAKVTYIPKRQPTIGFIDADIFAFKVNDKKKDSNPVTVRIKITPFNDAPIANVPPVVPARPNKTIDISLTGSDLDSDKLKFTVTSPPKNGDLSNVTEVSNDRGIVTYTPKSNFIGSDSFEFKVNDGEKDSPVVTVSISVAIRPAISVKTKPETVNLNSVFIVDIEAEAFTQLLAGFQFDIKFDKSILEVIEVVEGNFLKKNNGNTNFIRPKLDNTIGSISIVNVRMNPGGASGKGTLVNVKFIAKNKVDRGHIIIENEMLSDPSGRKMTRNRDYFLESGIITVAETSPWDVDGSGDVNVLDFVIVGQNFQKTDFDRRADVNQDGKVDVFDFVLVAQHFGETTAPSAPAPAAPAIAIEIENLNPEQIAVLERLYRIMDKMKNSDPEFLRIKEMLRELILLAPNQITHSRVLQNYPNPFNPETWIPYELAETAKVTITIYNALGHLVRTLQLGEKLRGAYVSKEAAAYWDGRNEYGESVAGGVYFYRLQAGRFSAVRKMTIIK